MEQGRPGVDAMLYWGLGLLAAALVLIVVDVFMPTGGVLVATACIAAVAGIVCLFRYDELWGGIGVLVVLVLGPTAVIFGLKVWPHTIVGRKIINAPTEEERARQAAAEEAERRRLASLVGKEARVVTDLRPIGVVEIDGTRYDARSETSFAPAGSRVRVSAAEPTQLRVRPVG